jgi:hypothetical protein
MSLHGETIGVTGGRLICCDTLQQPAESSYLCDPCPNPCCKRWIASAETLALPTWSVLSMCDPVVVPSSATSHAGPVSQTRSWDSLSTWNVWCCLCVPATTKKILDSPSTDFSQSPPLKRQNFSGVPGVQQEPLPLARQQERLRRCPWMDVPLTSTLGYTPVSSQTRKQAHHLGGLRGDRVVPRVGHTDVSEYESLMNISLNVLFL